MPPLTREAARWAGARAARQAASVYRAIVQGPEAPAPAGYGVEVQSFVEALPYLSVPQLVQCSSHFGQRGRAAGGLVSALAAELSGRLRPAQGEETVSGRLARSLSAVEVTTVFYAFSKISPQLPEYQLLYTAIGDGLVEGRWALNRLQSALVATALVDTEARLADALPATLQPLLTELVEGDQEEIGVDELRFVVHAAARLPRPGLTGAEIQALADCTVRCLQGAKFAIQAHLAVSWLRLVPAPSAKEAHLKALQACCRALAQHSQTYLPAHPLPREGLAPLLAELLAREAEQNAPPLTPPMLQVVVKGLVGISLGLRYQSSARSRSLSIDDWSEIMSMLEKYCEAHSSTTQAEAPSSHRNTLTVAQPSPLPNWAKQTLCHVLRRAQHTEIRRKSPSDWVQLSSLLTLLRLVRRHKPDNIEADFFSWAVRLVDVHQRNGQVEDGVVSDVVGELVPLLPEDQRSKLSRVIMARPQQPEPSRAPLAPSLDSAPLRLLRGEEVASTARAVLTPTSRPDALPDRPWREARAAGGARLWSLLAATAEETPLAEAAQPAQPQAQPARLLASAAEAAPAEDAAVSLQTTVNMDSAQTPSQPVEAGASASTTTVEELQRMLQSALHRVEALESKLADQQDQQDLDAAKAKDSCERSTEDEPRYNMLGRSEGWLTQILPPAAEQIQPSPAAATLHLRRAFNFEQFRRTQTARLDSERLRVTVPPDHFPLWTMMKK